jgi:AraC-like DNA-binding protein
MQQAKKALVIERLSIGEAAYIAGYNHTSNFIQAFKKTFALTPTEFIKRHRKGGSLSQ